jgi:Type IV secretory system Conjugative DNA transfer
MAGLIPFEYQDIPNWFSKNYQSNPDFRNFIFSSALGLAGVIGISKVWLRSLDELELKKPVYSVKLNFPQIEAREVADCLVQIEGILNGLAYQLQSERMSFEIHKTGNLIDLLVSCTSNELLNTIKRSFTTIKKLSMSEVIKDPLDIYSFKKGEEFAFANSSDASANAPTSATKGGNSKPHFIRQVYQAKSYFPINTQYQGFFKAVIDYLTSLESTQQASLLFCFKAIDRSYKIDQIISKKQLLREHERSLPPKTLQDISQYQAKQAGSIFLTRIYAVSNQKSVCSALCSKFGIFNSGSRNFYASKLLNRFNIFTSLHFSPLRLVQKRFVPQDTFFIRWLRKSYGSYLNTRELALLFHPDIIKRGAFKTQKVNILEASPDFVNPKADSILVGKSYKLTGEKLPIYLSANTRRRHNYLVGTTGSGKSTMLIREALSVAERGQQALVFFDPHQVDLVKVALRLQDWERVVYFDLTAENSQNIISFNPLFSFGTSITEKTSLAQDIIHILSEQAREKGQEMGTTILNMINLLVTTGVHFADAYYQFLIKQDYPPEVAKKRVFEKQITLPDLAFCLRKGAKYEPMFAKVFEDYTGSITTHVWTGSVRDSYSLNQAIISGIENRFVDFTNDTILPMLEGNKFRIDELVQQKKIILIPITNQSVGITTKKLLTKLTNISIWSSVQRLYDPSEPYICSIIIDEVQEAINPVIPRMLSEARKFGVSVTLAHQYLNQLVVGNDSSFLNAILGNVGSASIFQMQNIQEVKNISAIFGGEVSEQDVKTPILWTKILV